MKKPENIPSNPGIYKMLNKEEEVIYVGKAKNLNKRIRSYFNKSKKTIRIEKMVANIEKIKWIETESELEALILETNLIKELKPKYNIAMRDDKNFIYVRISLNEDFPRITKVRQFAKDGAKYFGPITAGHKIDKIFKILRKVLPFRTCNLDIRIEKNKTKVTHKTIKYPCLDHFIKRCCSPCISGCEPNEYRKIIDQVVNFLEGRPEEIIKTVKKNMMEAAENKKFELAASLRDKLALVKEISQKQVVSDPKMADLDVINFHREGTYVYINLFQIRNTRLINQENFTLKSAEIEENAKEILENFIKQYYEKAVSIPKEIVIPEKVDELLEKMVGSTFKVPLKGDKKNLLKLALKNAISYAKQSRIKNIYEEIDPVEELLKALKLKKRPTRIECYDISHLSGTNQVGSMIVFENGIGKNKDYRRFKIRAAKKSDDYASLTEILKRRLEYLGEIKNEYKIQKALKKESKIINNENFNEFYTIKTKKRVIGFIREQIINDKHILKSLWVDPSEGDFELGRRLIRHVIKKSKSKRLYLICNEKLGPYYEKLGFQLIKKIPKGLEAEDIKYNMGICSSDMKDICLSNTKGLWFAYDKKNNHDPSFNSQPDLIVIDGGKGQLKAAKKTLKLFGLPIPLISIAKKNEEIYMDSRKIILEKTSEALKLIQRIRDEAHRFAIEYQKKLRKFQIH